jgi:cystathionine beta-lyase/cystathionine gamma-synthase
MVAISIRGGAEAVGRFLSALRIVQVAPSLGGVESLASVPRETSHRPYSDAERAALGIDDGLVRLSLGIEDAQDLVRDLREALSCARGGPSPPL